MRRLIITKSLNPYHEMIMVNNNFLGISNKNDLKYRRSIVFSVERGIYIMPISGMIMQQGNVYFPGFDGSIIIFST